MHNYSKIIGAMAAASALVAGSAQAEVTVEYDLHAGYTSEYIFRGVDLGNDLVEAGVDASAQVAGLDLSAGAWYGSFNKNLNDTGDQTEIDIYGEVSKDLGFATASVGYIWYINDDNTDVKLDDAQEAYASISRDFGFAELALTYYWDVETDNDGYSAFDASKSFELNQCLTLNVGGTLGYLEEEGHLSHLTAKVSLDYAFAEHAKFSPFIAHSWDLSGGHVDDNGSLINTSAAPGTDNELFGGAVISASF